VARQNLRDFVKLVAQAVAMQIYDGVRTIDDFRRRNRSAVSVTPVGQMGMMMIAGMGIMDQVSSPFWSDG
jgi:hypothetical protein